MVAESLLEPLRLGWVTGLRLRPNRPRSSWITLSSREAAIPRSCPILRNCASIEARLEAGVVSLSIGVSCGSCKCCGSHMVERSGRDLEPASMRLSLRNMYRSIKISHISCGVVWLWHLWLWYEVDYLRRERSAKGCNVILEGGCRDAMDTVRERGWFSCAIRPWIH